MYKTHLYIRNIIKDTVQSPKTSRVRVPMRLKSKISKFSIPSHVHVHDDKS